MDKNYFDEHTLFLDFQQQAVKQFLNQIATYDEEMAKVMKGQGYKLHKKDKRTVLFTFGEVTFYRNRWSKNGDYRVPVDEFLGLEKYDRHSRQLAYEITRLTTFTSYRKTVDIIETTYKLNITKSLVVKVLKQAEQLVEEREAYRFYEESLQTEKIRSDIIYVEGDGVMVKVLDTSRDETVNMELSHFLTHTGSRQVGKNRFALENKKTFISDNNHQIRQEVVDYLYNHFQISADTMLVTNSDHGKGYTPYIFEELAQDLGIKRHEHFWDSYHLNQLVDTFFKPFSNDLREMVYEGIRTHRKKLVKLALDTAESQISDKEFAVDFEKFSRRLLRDFRYTKPAVLRGLPSGGIGVMESQHRKVTYRMKRQGRYWSRRGAVTMSKLILMTYENTLEDLFFGNWREDYAYYQELEKVFPSDYLKEKQTRDGDYYLTGKYHGSWKL